MDITEPKRLGLAPTIISCFAPAEGIHKVVKMIIINRTECSRRRRRRQMVDAMFANPKFTDEDIAAISGIPQDEIAKRRLQRH